MFNVNFIFKKWGGQNFILLICGLLAGNLNAQIFTVDFNSDICGGNGCDMQTDLIDDGCVYVNNPDIPILSLGGFNKITNSCDTWLAYGDGSQRTTTLNYGSDRKLIMQNYASVAPAQTNNFVEIGEQQGIFFDIKRPYLKNNYFYQVQYDVEHIIPYGCSHIDEETGELFLNPGAPSISVFSNTPPDFSSSGAFIAGDNGHNEYVRSNYATLLGTFSTKGFQVGSYVSPIYKFQFFQEEDENYYSQIGIFLYGQDAGLCDDGLEYSNNQGGGSASPILLPYQAGLIDNIRVDCDSKNIVFGLEVELVPFNELTNCNDRLYRARLTTDCPNVNYSNFNYSLKIKNSNNQIIKTIVGSGQDTYFTMDEFASGQFQAFADFDTSNGYNVLVEEYGYSNTGISFAHVQNGPYQVSGDIIIDTDVFVPSNLEILPGATLTVRSTMYFKEFKNMIVESTGKLSLEPSGHLTACVNYWDGVSVAGSGEVDAFGTISLARIGIDALGDSPTEITCTGAHFIDNIVGVAAYHQTIPIFTSCDFTGGSQGVYLDYVTGGTSIDNRVLFEGNTFSYQTEQGIIAWNTPLNVRDGNTFQGCNEGIIMRNLFGLRTQSRIGDGDGSNLFSNCEVAIYANGNDQEIQNNTFINNNNATWMSGNNGYESYQNTFSGGYTAELMVGIGGTLSNYSSHNEISSIHGIRSFYDNPYYSFLSNCFYSGDTDVLAYGTISGSQGGLSTAASNCFTGGYVTDFNCQTSNNVDYYIPKPTVSYPECLKPKDYIPLEESSGINTDGCGNSLNGPNINEYDYIKALGCNEVKLKELIAKYKAELAKFKTSATPLTKNQKAHIAWLNRHLRYAINQWAWCLRKQNKLPELYQWYKQQEGKEFAILAAEVKVMMGLYNEAISEINEAQSLYFIDKSVTDAMIMCIQRQRPDIDPAPYSQEDIDVLRKVAQMSDPYATYGRSLLYRLTAEKIEPPLPVVTELRSKVNEKGNLEKYLLHPNPAFDNFVITLEDFNSIHTYTYSLYDMNNKLIGSSRLDSHNRIDVTSLAIGMYIVKIYKNGENVSNNKLIVIK